MKTPPRVVELVNNAKAYLELAAAHRAFAAAVEDLAEIDLDYASQHLAVAAIYARKTGALDPEEPKSSRPKTRRRRKS